MHPNRKLPSVLLDGGTLWIVGFVFLEVYLLESVIAAPPEAAYRSHWLIYLFVGLATPLLFAAAVLRSGSPRIVRNVQLCAVGFLGCWITRFLIGADREYVLLFLIFQAAVLWRAGAFRTLKPDCVAAAMALGCVGWIVMMPLTLEISLAALPATSFGYLVVPIFIAVGAFFSVALTNSNDASRRPASTLRTTGSVLAVVLTAILSFRITSSYGPAEAHHWSFWVGPAHLVRQGGWLLWDVPSQYGFLNELAIALIPTPSTWDATKVVLSALTALSAMLLYWMLSERRRSRWSWVLAVAVPVAVVVLTPGSSNNSDYLGYPSGSPLRFFWPCALVALLAKIYVTGPGRDRSFWFRVGNVAWVAGSLWCAESAIYSTFTWIPAIVLDGFLAARSAGNSVKAAAFAGLRRLGPIVALTIGVVMTINILYAAAIHHLPDWYSFIEFGLLYTGGVARYELDPTGSVWLLLLASAFVAAVFIAVLRGGTIAAFPLLAGTWGMLFATSSYFLVRSANSNVNLLLPEIAFALAALLLVIDREVFDVQGKILQIAMTPFFAWTAVLTLGNVAAFRLFTLPFFPGYPWSMTVFAPPVDPHIVRLRAKARAHDEDRYLAIIPRIGWDQFQVWQQHDGSLFEPKPWLMIEPGIMFMQLSQERQLQYTARSVERHPWSGWLIADHPVACTDFVPDARQTSTVTDEAWTMAYCSPPVVSTPAVARPRPLTSANAELFGSLDELYFNGRATFKAYNAPVLVPQGKPLDIRGWLVRLDGRAVTGVLYANVDGHLAARARYGLTRPDVPAYMLRNNGRTYPDDTGFHLVLRTASLAAGPHQLEFGLRERNRRVLLQPAIPFSVY